MYKKFAILSILLAPSFAFGQYTPPPGSGGGGGGGSMVYPAAGVPCSTGSAWCSSYSLTTTLASPGADTNVASEKAVRSAIAAAVSAITASSLGLATVATSGSYLDLSNKPTIPAAQVNSDWNASSGLAQILNKPAFITSVFGSAGPIIGALGDIGATGLVTKIQGGAIPTSAPLIGTNGSGQVITASAPTIPGPLTVSPTGGGAGAVDFLCGTTPSNPSSGYITPFCNSANSNHLSVVNSAGTVTDLQSGGTGGYVLLSEQILASPASTVSFPSIPSTYRNLRLVVTARCSASQTDDGIYLQFNGDTTGNYSRQYSQVAGTTYSAGQTLNSSIGFVLGDIACATSLSNAPGVSIIDIPDYSGTVFLKTGVSTSGGVTSGGSSSNLRVFTSTALWNNTAAVSSMVVGVYGGSNFVTGSVFDLYVQ
jgi:hypothetical protein